MVGLATSTGLGGAHNAIRYRGAPSKRKALLRQPGVSKCVSPSSRSEREGHTYQALPRHQGQQAACIAGKYAVVTRIAERHAAKLILVIGHYLAQLRTPWPHRRDRPLITGDTPHAQRDAYYAAFRAGQIAQLIVSRVGNQAVDLPSASVLIQVSGSLGSRQEEAQRLGRILRPKGPRPRGRVLYNRQCTKPRSR
jgi:superfamily II DNA or RNA helicase